MTAKAERIQKLLCEYTSANSDDKPLLLSQLRAQCDSEFGLVTDSIRKQLWPILLDTSVANDLDWQDLSVMYKDERQVRVDVERSLNAYDVTDDLEDGEK